MRTSLRASLGALAAATLSITDLSLLPTARATPTPAPAYVVGSATGPTFSGFGLDLKKWVPKNNIGPDHLKTRSWYRQRLAHPGMQYVRVGFSAQDAKDGHFDKTKDDGHANHIQMLRYLKEIETQHGKDVKVYASPRKYAGCGTPKTCFFHQSLKDSGNNLSPTRYGRFVGQYLHHLRDNGVAADYIGLENEPNSNEGNLTPARFDQAVATMRSVYPHPVTVVGNDTNSNDPDPQWVQSSRSIRVAAVHSHANKWPTHLGMDVVSGTRQVAQVARAKGIPAWNSEFHLDESGDQTPFITRQARSLKSLMSQHSAGFQTIMWWHFVPSDAFLKEVMTSMMVSRARTVTSKMPGVFVYANNQGNVWVVNDSSTSYGSRKVADGDFSFTRWTNAGSSSGTGTHTLGFPARTITLINAEALPVAPPPEAAPVFKDLRRESGKTVSARKGSVEVTGVVRGARGGWVRLKSGESNVGASAKVQSNGRFKLRWDPSKHVRGMKTLRVWYNGTQQGIKAGTSTYRTTVKVVK